MSNYVLSCCSTADLSREHFEKRDISYLCFHFFMNDQPPRYILTNYLKKVIIMF